jgi:hypothetical protein
MVPIIILSSIVLIYICHVFGETRREYFELDKIVPADIQTGDLWFGTFNSIREQHTTVSGKILKMGQVLNVDVMATHVGLCYRDPDTDRLFVASIMWKETDEPLRKEYNFGQGDLQFTPFEFMSAFYDYVMVMPIHRTDGATPAIPYKTLDNAIRDVPSKILSGGKYLYPLVKARLSDKSRPELIPDDRLLCSEWVYEILCYCGVFQHDPYNMLFPGDLYHSKTHKRNIRVRTTPSYYYDFAKRLSCPRGTYYGDLIHGIHGLLEHGPIEPETIFV